MPSEVNMNTAARQASNTINETMNFAKGLGLSEKATENIKDVAAILSSRSVSLTSKAGGTDETGKAPGATNVPALDNPDDAKALEANLEKLIAYLQLDNEERQAEMAKERIEVNKDSLETEHKNRKEKIEKTLKDMEKAEKASKLNRIFGWLATALAIVVAVVACVATAGLAVGAVVGAGVALGMQIMSETGAMEKITNALSGALEKAGMSKQAAAILSAVIIAVAAIALSIGSGAGAAALASHFSKAAQATATVAQAAGAGAQAAQTTAKTVSGLSMAVKAGAEAVRPALTIGTRVLQMSTIGTGGAAAYTNYEAGMSQADTKEAQQILAQLQQRIEESEEELNAILQAIENSLSNTAQLLSSATDTSGEIAKNIGQMA